jgi:hypothetical protein
MLHAAVLIHCSTVHSLCKALKLLVNKKCLYRSLFVHTLNLTCPTANSVFLEQVVQSHHHVDHRRKDGSNVLTSGVSLVLAAITVT